MSKQPPITPASEAIDCCIGFIKFGSQRVDVEYEVPANASDAERDSAFLDALAQKVEINYLVIGSRKSA